MDRAARAGCTVIDLPGRLLCGLDQFFYRIDLDGVGIGDEDQRHAPGAAHWRKVLDWIVGQLLAVKSWVERIGSGVADQHHVAVRGAARECACADHSPSTGPVVDVYLLA